MSYKDDAALNFLMAQRVEELLQDLKPDQRGAIYTMLLIYTANTLGASKEEVINMIDKFFDIAPLAVPQKDPIFN